MQNKFSGPLFLVGMPRSGTKLLRSLLNEHEKISIMDIETEFLIYWKTNWQKFGDLSKFDNFNRFYKKNINMSYFKMLNDRNDQISCVQWYNMCDKYDVSGVFEALIRHDTSAEKDTNIIWGDKSPSYTKRMAELKELYPNAKIIHIVRDVRDYCLSINKAWKKNMVRAAQRWSDDVSGAIECGRNLDSSSYYEIKYEALLENPEQELKKICNFLNIGYRDNMVQLSLPSENIGDAKGETKIIKGNINKYNKYLSESEIEKIERVSITLLRKLNYSTSYSGKEIKINNTRMWIYKIFDGANLIISEAKNRGVIGALKYHILGYLVSPNRH